MDVSIHIHTLFTGTCSDCLEKFITWLFTGSIQPKSLRSIWPSSLYRNIFHAYIHAVLSYIHETVLPIPSIPNHCKCSYKPGLFS